MEQFFLKHGLPVEDREIERFINNAGVKLPLEYIDFLKKINGGVTKNVFFELRSFDVEAINTNLYIRIDDFFEFKELDQIWNFTNTLLDDDNLFPIAEARGGMLICCEQSNAAYAHLFYYDNDFGIIQLTDSLIEFFNLLIPEGEVDYKKYGIG